MRSFVLCLLSMVSILHPYPAHGERGPASVDCLIDAGPCERQVGNMSVAFEMSPRPVRAMSKLEVTVRIESPPIGGDGISVSFEMPGMDMGENRVVLRRISRGLYRGNAVIVNCPGGGKTWRAEVLIPGTKGADFTFHVLH